MLSTKSRMMGFDYVLSVLELSHVDKKMLSLQEV